MARRQTAGRGRSGRHMGLGARQSATASLVLRPGLPARRGAAAVAAGRRRGHRGHQGAAASSCTAASPACRLKRPNDVLIGGARVRGHPARKPDRAAGDAAGSPAVIGIGINLAWHRTRATWARGRAPGGAWRRRWGRRPCWGHLAGRRGALAWRIGIAGSGFAGDARRRGSARAGPTVGESTDGVRHRQGADSAGTFVSLAEDGAPGPAGRAVAGSAGLTLRGGHARGGRAQGGG